MSSKYTFQDELINLKNQIWKFINIFRGELPTEEYCVILYLLILINEKVFPVKSGIGNKNSQASVNDLRNAIEHLTGPKYHAIHHLNSYFAHILAKLSEGSIIKVTALASSINKDLLHYAFPEIFDDILYALSKLQGRLGGEFVQPKELSRFLCNFADLEDNQKIYNPFAGLASFGIFLRGTQHYFGQEINLNTWAIGSLRLIACNQAENSELALDDSISNWNPNFELYDLIIANPPFGMRLADNYTGNFGPIRTCEQFLIEKSIDDLKTKGKLIAIIPQGFLSRPGPEQHLRKHIVDNDLLEYIISLPGGLLTNTAIPITILVVNKDKKEKGLVRFVDAKNFVISGEGKDKFLKDDELLSFIRTSEQTDSIRAVTNSAIADNDFNLTSARYFIPQRFFDTDEKLETIGEFATILKGQRVVENQNGKYIRIKDLSADKLYFDLELQNIDSGIIPKFAQKISESCLLLATRWIALKPTYFKYTGEEIYLSPDIVALKINELKVDVAYLINVLFSQGVLDQIDSFRYGSPVPAIKKEDILRVKIPIFEIAEQRASVKGAIDAVAEEKKKEIALFKKIHGLESEIIEQNTYLRHSLAGPASNLKGSLSNLKNIVANKIISELPDVMNLKVSDNHELTFGDYLEIIERDILKISGAVSKQLKVETDIETKELIPIDIAGFIRKYLNELMDKEHFNFTTSLEIDKELFLDDKGEIYVYIKGNKDLLTSLFDNLIDNAVKHAFKRENTNRIEVFLTRNPNADLGNDIQVLVSNTGTPFSEGFNHSDFIRKGSKAGASAGEGFGGWYISEIIKKMNGSFDIIDETGPEGLPDTDLATTFEISFPIIDTDEEI